LQSVTSLLHDVKTLIVQAGNGTMTNTDRQYIATELQGRFDELLGLANTRDGVGNYMFAGFQTATQPFTASNSGANYAGDQGTLQLQVHTARQIPVAQNGYGLFERIDSTGTGALASAAGAANTGGAQVSRPTVTDASLVPNPPDSYSIAFSTVLGVKSYVVTNTTTGVAGAVTPYVSGDPIALGGLEVKVTDKTAAPADGDTFTVAPANNQGIFTTLKDLINILQTPASTVIERGNLTRGLSIANANVDKSLDHVLTARASIGASMKEVDSLDALGEDINVQYAQSLADLQDLDYVQAITELTKQQTALQAAQQSYIKVTSLSLFNFLP